jgi:hypothetical protein
MEEYHLWNAIRYVELNPVRAGLAESPERFRWSSAAAHLSGSDNGKGTAWEGDGKGTGRGREGDSREGDGKGTA